MYVKAELEESDEYKISSIIKINKRSQKAAKGDGGLASMKISLH